ncbi:YgiT-type zinc finger protein [Clostridium sp. B9]|uniref:YgiT-type zinc finger protein n=1 Tax=Clostridium sp. B9 TaxID=3423224 RepID=UPI003D2EE553
MFRCKDCKKWLRDFTTDFDVEYEGKVIKAINVPGKKCPKCGMVFVHDIVRNRIIQYSLQKNMKVVDYFKCEEEEGVIANTLL